MAVSGSVAAALLCLGGFGAVVYGAGPGDALYGVRASLFGEQQVTRDDQVALAAQTEMQQVQQLIDQGKWDAAQDKLQTVTSTVQTVEDPQRQQELQQQLNELSAKVETRDPDAIAAARGRVPAVPNVPVPSAGTDSLPPLPQLPPSAPGMPLPDISLPQLPPRPQLPLPGPGVPPDISSPDLPQIAASPLRSRWSSPSRCRNPIRTSRSRCRRIQSLRRSRRSRPSRSNSPADRIAEAVEQPKPVEQPEAGRAAPAADTGQPEACARTRTGA